MGRDIGLGNITLKRRGGWFSVSYKKVRNIDITETLNETGCITPPSLLDGQNSDPQYFKPLEDLYERESENENESERVSRRWTYFCSDPIKGPPIFVYTLVWEVSEIGRLWSVGNRLSGRLVSMYLFRSIRVGSCRV